MSLYFNGGLQTVEIAGSEYQAAGAAVTKGPPHILAQVMGPQQSCRAEMYGAAIRTVIASNRDQMCIGNAMHAVRSFGCRQILEP